MKLGLFGGLLWKFEFLDYNSSVKLTLVLISTVLASFGSASFEMALITVDGNRPGGGSYVQRWDPVDRINLGTFGSSYLTSAKAIVNRNGIAYVLDRPTNTHSTVYRFDYNTGAYLGETNFAGYKLNQIDLANNGDLLVTGQDSGNAWVAKQFNLAGVETKNIALHPSNIPYDIMQDSSGYYHIGTENGGVWLCTNNTDGSLYTFFFVGGFSPSTNKSVHVTRGANGIHIATLASYDLAAGTGTSVINYYAWNGTSYTQNVTPSFSTGVTAGLSEISMGDVDMGHGSTGWGLTLRKQSGAGYVGYDLVNHNTSSNIYRYSQSLPGDQSWGYSDISMVIAPEPGCLVAFVGGMALLARRRK